MTHLWSIGFQVINFLVLLFLLHRYLWKPVRATIDQRQKEIDDADASVKARAKATDELRVAYEAKVAAADKEREAMLKTTAATLATDRDKVLADAHAATEKEALEARKKLDAERATATTELVQSTLDVAVSVAEKLLDEVHGAAVTGAFVDRLSERLDRLPPEEIASLRAELTTSPTLTIATTPALADTDQTRLGAHLASMFGASTNLNFVVDDSLIAGAELRFPHARLGHSFRHSLVAARVQLSTLAPKATSMEHPLLSPHLEISDS
ncbi:MAG: F0F1 ATP synthase subunit delta [Polyangiales bacterium]